MSGMTLRDDDTLRRYVLGTATPEESDAIERDYFDAIEGLDLVSAAEDDLVDDYMSGRLEADDLARFERYYLATPRHRTRVAVARSLRAAVPAAPIKADARSIGRLIWLPAAAGLVLLAGGAAWIIRSTPEPTPVTVNATPPPSERSLPPPAAPVETPEAVPVVIALSLEPISVRGAGASTALVVPAGTDIVALLLAREAGEAELLNGRAIVRTVEGTEVWRGPAAPAPDSKALARLEIPAGRLTPDDYMVELMDADAGGRESERHRYFLRVRTR